MTFTIHRVSRPRDIMPVRLPSVPAIKMYFAERWAQYQLEMFEETGDGQEIFIIIANYREHIRFVAKRGI